MSTHRVSLKQLLKIGTEVLATTAQTLSGAINELRSTLMSADSHATAAYNKAEDAEDAVSAMQSTVTTLSEDVLDHTSALNMLEECRLWGATGIFYCMSPYAFFESFMESNVSGYANDGLKRKTPKDVNGVNVAGVTIQYIKYATAAPGMLYLLADTTSRSGTKYLKLFSFQLPKGTYRARIAPAPSGDQTYPDNTYLNVIVRKNSWTGTSLGSTSSSARTVAFTLTAATTIYVLLSISSSFRSASGYVAPSISIDSALQYTAGREARDHRIHTFIEQHDTQLLNALTPPMAPGIAMPVPGFISYAIPNPAAGHATHAIVVYGCGIASWMDTLLSYVENESEDIRDIIARILLSDGTVITQTDILDFAELGISGTFEIHVNMPSAASTAAKTTGAPVTVEICYPDGVIYI